jgi:transposase
VRRAIRAAGARLFYLPKYSPDLNPIEQFFAKFKHWLRKADERPFLRDYERGTGRFWREATVDFQPLNLANCGGQT